MMNCGELLPDKNTIHQMLMGALAKNILKETTDHLHGLSVQNIKKTLSLCSVYYDKLTVDTIRKTKEMLFINQVGITKVEKETQFFFPVESSLMDWAEQNKHYMFKDIDQRLIPKGLLLHGDAGTGKTEFARFIARSWGLPLFLLDMNSMLSKWQGEAEQHLNKALATLDNESPCIILFDEVEKLFAANSENDTSQRLLSKILWWLQYKTSRVLVVMTCNNMEVIPPELYRAGRLNKSIEMKGIPIDGWESFVAELLLTYTSEDQPDCIDSVGKEVTRFVNETTGGIVKKEKAVNIPQAMLSQWVVDYLIESEFGL